MSYKKIFFSLLSLFPLLFCSCTSKVSKTITIAYDPTFYPLNLYGKQANVNGFFQDLLLEMATHDKHTFELVTANWDNLYDNLSNHKAIFVFGSQNPYSFNEEKLLFSPLIISTGPVLVIASTSQEQFNLKGKEIGVQEGSKYGSLELLQENAIVRNFKTIPDGLQMVQKGQLDGIIIPQIAALSYIQDLYASSLVIATKPFTQEGLRFIALKTSKDDAHYFFSLLDKMEKNGKMDALRKKWNL